jgi:hypothetical protein
MTHPGSEKKSHKNKTKMSENQMKLRVIHIWSNRGCTVRLSQKLAVCNGKKYLYKPFHVVLYVILGRYFGMILPYFGMKIYYDF